MALAQFSRSDDARRLKDNRHISNLADNSRFNMSVRRDSWCHRMYTLFLFSPALCHGYAGRHLLV